MLQTAVLTNARLTGTEGKPFREMLKTFCIALKKKSANKSLKALYERKEHFIKGLLLSYTDCRLKLGVDKMVFQVENVTERIYRITMPYVCSYLVVGKDEAVLLDAGWGYGDLKAVVESITDLPVTLLLSHGHPDHNGSASQFETVYLHEGDFEMIEGQNQVDLRRRLMLRNISKDFKENPDLWQPARKAPYSPLIDEQAFELGDLSVLSFHVPGHSRGSMVFIIPEERIAVFGDAISHPTLIIFDNSSTMKAHYEALEKLNRQSHLFDRVLVNHETYELDKIVLENNLNLAKAIVEGKDEKILASKRSQRLSPESRIYMARKRQSWLPDDPAEIGNIYYREDKV